jgi:hypothetical protein
MSSFVMVTMPFDARAAIVLRTGEMPEDGPPMPPPMVIADLVDRVVRQGR